MEKLEQLELAIMLSRGTQLANKIILDCEDPKSNGVDQEDAAALARNFLKVRDILVSIREDSTDNSG